MAKEIIRGFLGSGRTPGCQMTERYLMVVSGEESAACHSLDRTNEHNGGRKWAPSPSLKRGGGKMAAPEQTTARTSTFYINLLTRV